MSAQPVRAYLGISEVLAQLRGEFPDVSVSKIRFLETEGLIAPARSPSGYRRFASADVDRLRYILAAQRDQYLPLRVIRDRLARLGPAGDPGGTGPGGAGPGATSGTGAAGPATGRDRPAFTSRTTAGSPAGLLSRSELVAAAGLTEALLTELETFGLVRRVGRLYGPDAFQVARAAGALTSYGVQARHLRAVRAAAEREAAMIESLAAPILQQRSAGAKDLASRMAAEVAEEVLRLHGALVDGALAEAGLAGPAPRQSDDSARAAAGPGRGVAGASA